MPLVNNLQSHKQKYIINEQSECYILKTTNRNIALLNVSKINYAYQGKLLTLFEVKRENAINLKLK